MNRNLLLLLVLLALLLAACGEAAPAEPMAAATATATPAVGGVPTDPTAVPAPTLEPTAEATAVPTAEPTAAPTAVPDPAPVDDAPQTACDHPYFPMRPGSTWTYLDEASGATLIWTITEVSGNTESATAQMVALIGLDGQDIRLDYNWQCSAAEGLVSFDYATLSNLNTGMGELNFEMESVEGTGVLFPPAAQLTPGFSWAMATAGTFLMNMDVMGTAVSANGVTDVNQASQVLDAALVTYEGATYDGLTILRDMTVSTQTVVSGVAVNAPTTTLTLQTTLRMARGIGPVEQTTTSDFGNERLVLIAYEIP